MSQLTQSLLDALSAGSIYALAALGIGLVFGVMRLANFAHGETITASAYTLVLLWHVNPVLALVGALIAGVGLAMLMELVVFRRFRNAGPATLLIVSFGLSFLLQRVYESMFTSNPKTAPVASGLSGSVNILGLRVQLLSVVSIVLTALLLIGLRYFLTRTTLGLQVRAASADFRTARLLGVRANWVIALTFGIAGLLAAVIAFVLTVRSGAVMPTFGVQVTTLALVGAVLGGIDSIVGSLVGGFIMGFSTSVFQSWLPAGVVEFRDAFVFAIVILMLLYRPSGLLAPKGTVERT